MIALHFIKSAIGCGWALRQVRELVRLGIDVHVALPHGPLTQSYRDVGATVHVVESDFPVSAPWRLAVVLPAIRRLVRKIQPDVIHSHTVGSTLSVRLALRPGPSIPRIFQVPGPLHLEHAAFREAEIATADASDYWIASCRWTRERYHRSGISPSRLFLSYYGTDTGRFSSRPTGRLRAALGVPASTRLVGIVAFMYAPRWWLGQERGLKGHEDLIDAMSLLQPRYPDLHCVCIGGAWAGATWYADRIHQHARRKCPARVSFLGTRDDVPDLYPDIDIAVHPSHSENLGGAAESLLAGRPTIATNVGGFPDIVIHGRTGLLAPRRNPVRLSQCIRRYCDDPDEAREHAVQGMELVRNVLDVRKTAAEIAEIYARVTA